MVTRASTTLGLLAAVAIGCGPGGKTVEVYELIINGPPEACREHVERYVENGLHTPVLAVLPSDVDLREATRKLAPN